MTQSSEEIQFLIVSAQLDDLEAVEQDINNALKNRRSHFRLKIDDFFFENGTQNQLLSLYGTVATDYFGARYNIPVDIWLQESHPFSAPICYVKPAPNMFISSTCPDVKLDGKIVNPYLINWIPLISSLTKLIDELCRAFSVNSPLYTKPPRAVQQTSIPIPNTLNRPSTAKPNNNSNDGDVNNNRCRICLENDIDCVLLECGHLVSCSTCATHFTTCPVCRAQVVRTKRIFRT